MPEVTTITSALDEATLLDAVRERCDPVQPALPFLRSPVAGSKPFAVELRRRAFVVWKRHDGLWPWVVRRMQCAVDSTGTGLRLALRPARRPLFATACVLVVRLMLVLALAGLAVTALGSGVWRDLWFFVVFAALLAGANVVLAVVLSAAGRIEARDHDEIRAMLAEVAAGRPGRGAF